MGEVVPQKNVVDMSNFWKSKSQIAEEKRRAEEESIKLLILEARKENLLSDTEVLAEMVMHTMMENMEMAQELRALRLEMEGLKNG